MVCKRVQQLPTIRGPAVHCGKTTHKTLRPCVLRVRGPNNVLSGANESNIITLRFGDYGTKEMLAVVDLKV